MTPNHFEARLKRIFEILHPPDDPGTDWSAQTTHDIAQVVYELYPEPPDPDLLDELPVLSGEKTLCRSCRSGIGLPRGCQHGLERTKCEHYEGIGRSLADITPQFLEANDIECDHLDGAVDDEKSRQGAAVNNHGIDAQVEYLLGCGWSEEDTLRAIMGETDRRYFLWLERRRGIKAPVAGYKSRKSGLMVRCLRCGKGVSARTAHLVSKDGTDRYCCPACWDERLR